MTTTIEPYTTVRRVPVDLSQPCSSWQGDRSDQGYGRVMIDSRTLYVHRLAYQLHVGPIHRGWEVDHLCHNVAFDAGLCVAGPCEHRSCFNPAHLDAVPSRVNSERGGHPLYAVKRRDTCRRGHDMNDPSNVYLRRDGRRRCRTCMRINESNRGPR